MARIHSADRKPPEQQEVGDNRILSVSEYRAEGHERNGHVMAGRQSPNSHVEDVKPGTMEPSAFAKAHPPKHTKLPSRFDAVRKAMRTWLPSKRLVAYPPDRSKK